MTDADFEAGCRALVDRLLPAEGRDGPAGGVAAEAALLRELLGRYGTCRQWQEALRRTLAPFARAWIRLEREASEARAVGHDYPDRDTDAYPVSVGWLRRAAELLGRGGGNKTEGPVS